jgi:SpoVK/Ycf46/Vps4 family AAA+-type ATPase
MDLYRKIGIDPPRGVLLYGPPGKLRCSGYKSSADDVQELERQCWSRQSRMLPKHLSSELSDPSLCRST